MTDIALICPTRQRPEWFMRMLESAYITADNPKSLEVMVYIDDDEPYQDEYIKRMQEFIDKYNRPFGLFELSIQPQKPLSEAHNYLVERSTANILIPCNDDQIFRSQSWDKRITEECAKFPDEVYLIWVNDGHSGSRKCCFPIVSRKSVNHIGYFLPEVFFHQYADTWLYDVYKRLGREHYVDDVLIEHMHYHYGKSEMDELYNLKQNILKEEVKTDQLIYNRTEPVRIIDANRLKELTV